MNKIYNRINWENYPSDSTPLNESNLNRIDSATDTLDNRVISLDNTKATKTEVATLVQDVTFEEKTGIITITKKNGSKVTIDTQMEKIAVNFDYDATTQKIILTLIDGTKQYIDLAALITQYEFLDTETIAFSIDSTGKVSAIVKEASIEEKHLQPNYLADIKVETAKATASQKAAAASEINAKTSETNSKNNANNASASATKAQSYAVGGTNSRTGENTDNAKYYSEQAAEKQKTATQNANTATTKASEAAKSAEAAKASENVAIQSANTAAEKAKSATDSATSASNSANTAIENATKSKKYAVGDTDSAKYYYEKAKEAVDGAGAVTGVKGYAESTYRTGNVNLTPANIGALATTGGVITGDVIPHTNEYIDLGHEDKKWDNVWTHELEADYVNAKEGIQGNLTGNADTASGIKPIDITGKTIDVNTLTLSTGTINNALYVERTDGGANNIKNIPVSGKPFKLYVDLVRWGSTIDYITKQTFVSSKSGTASTYERWCANGVWTSWLPNTRFTTNPTSGQVLIADGVNGGIKTSGYTIASSVPANAKFTDTKASNTTKTTSGNNIQGTYRCITLSDGSTKILCGATTLATPNINQVYGNAYWQDVYIDIPSYFSDNGICSINITPHIYGAGLMNVQIIGYTTSYIAVRVFSPKAQTISCSFMVCVMGY